MAAHCGGVRLFWPSTVWDFMVSTAGVTKLCTKPGCIFRLNCFVAVLWAGGLAGRRSGSCASRAMRGLGLRTGGGTERKRQGRGERRGERQRRRRGGIVNQRRPAQPPALEQANRARMLSRVGAAGRTQSTYNRYTIGSYNRLQVMVLLYNRCISEKKIRNLS